MKINLKVSKSIFLRDGFCVLRDIVPKSLIDDLKKAIKGQCLYLANHNNIELDKTLGLDKIYNVLCSHDRGLGSIIFENVRYLPEFLALVSCKNIRDIAVDFLDSEVLFSPNNSNTFRIDRHGEDEHKLNWHQDYTYEFLSNPSLTFWVPIVDTPSELGPPIIIAGSQKELKKTKFTLAKNMHGRDKVIPIISKDELKVHDSEIISDDFHAGDVLVMDTFVVHKSGENKSKTNNRWTAQIRIGTFEDKGLAERNWSFETSETFEFFKKYKPELTVYPKK